MRALALCLALTLTLAGCWSKPPRILQFSMSSFSYSPVLVLGAEVDGVSDLPIFETVVAAAAEDLDVPRDLGIYSMDWSAGGRDTVTVRAQWVELRTDTAWQAEAVIAPQDLERYQEWSAELTVVFGPHGQMIVASDPMPDQGPRRDLVQVCGQRLPEADRDVSAGIDAIGGLARALARDYAPVPASTPCPEPQE